jgi:hypothetical protein
MEIKPYIGVTGISQIENAQIIGQAFKDTLPSGASHQGMAGYLVSSDTLGGLTSIYEKYPPMATLSPLLQATAESALNVFHYRTNYPAGLVPQVIGLFAFDSFYSDGLCQAIQFNLGSNPSKEELSKIKDAYPDLRVIFSLRSRTLKERSREHISDMVGNYGDLIDFVLLDRSGGRGKKIDLNSIPPLYRLLRYDHPQKPVIISGGFCDRDVLTILRQLRFNLNTTKFGIDAEAGLREGNEDNPHAGRLSLPKTIAYIQAAASFFKDSRNPSL